MLEPVVGAQRAQEVSWNASSAACRRAAGAGSRARRRGARRRSARTAGAATASIIPVKRARGRICESALGESRRGRARRVDRVPPRRVGAASRARSSHVHGDLGGAGGRRRRRGGRAGAARRRDGALTACSAATSSARRLASELEAAGVRVHSPPTDEPQRRGFVLRRRGRRADDHGDRREAAPARAAKGRCRGRSSTRRDGVYFTAATRRRVRQARRARVLVATARELPTLHAAGVELDALVASGEDEAERYQAGDLDPPPKLVVSTAGALGGWAQPGGPYKPAVAAGAVRGRLRRRRLLRRRAHLRAGEGDGGPGRARVRLRARRARAHPPRRGPQRLTGSSDVAKNPRRP